MLRIDLEIVDHHVRNVVAHSVSLQDLMDLGLFLLGLGLHFRLLARLFRQVMLSLQQRSHKLAKPHGDGAAEQLSKPADDDDVTVVQDCEAGHDGKGHGDAICNPESRRVQVLEVAAMRFDSWILRRDGLSLQS